MMGRREWHTALVTGTASGIGREFCRQLAARGCTLAMVDVAPMEGTVAVLPPGHPVKMLRIDLTAPDSPERIVTWLDSEGIVPDLVVNNAGIFDFAAVQALSPERLNLYIDLHIRSVTHLSRLMAMRMAEGEGGSILNMSSMSCWMPMPGIAMYAATKAYIRVFSRALATEMSGTGVTVTVACPGGIATDLFGLKKSLQRLGVRTGALATPERFVKGALKRASRGKRQYINGPVNRVAIVAVAALPESARKLIKTKILARYGKLQ